MSNESGIKNIYQRINAVMLDVEAVQKESKKVNNQYTFVSHDAVAAALHKPMAVHGIVMIPTIAELVRDGNRTSVKMDIAFVNADNGEDRINIVSYGDGIDPQDKGIGKAVSYAVKYGLLKLFVLETGDDVERDNIDYKADAPKAPSAPKIISDAQVSELKTIIGGNRKILNEALKHLGVVVERVSDLPVDKFEPLKQYCVNKLIDMEAASGGIK